MCAAEPAATISFRKAIDLALSQNPELTVYERDVGISEARRLHATLRPNPEASLVAEDFAGSGDFRGVDSVQSTLQLSQRLELGGKRAARIEAAEAGRGVADFEYESRRLRVATETAQAFIDLLGAQERLALARDALSLAERLVPSLRKRVRAGRSSTVEATRAQVAVTSARIVVEKEEGQVVRARARLAARWGSTTPWLGEAKGDLEETPSLPALDVLRQRVADHPALARSAADRVQRQARVAVEESKAKPDVTVMGGVRYLNGTRDGALVVGLSVPLPLMNRNQGNIGEARLLALRASEEIRALEIALNTQLAIAYESLEDATIEFTLLRSSVLPELQKAFEFTNEGYLAGRFSYLELTDSRRALAEARLQYLQALINHHKAATAIAGLTGELTP